MKKKILSTILVSTITLAAVPAVVNAAAPSTKGDVTFEADDDKEGGNPGEPRDGSQVGITPPADPNDSSKKDGSHGSGSIRLEWVPNFHFGSHKISSGDGTYSAEWTNDVVIDPTGAAETVSNYPQFAQVTDESGKSTSKWKLELTQSVFTGDDSGTTVTLPNTYIMLLNTQAYNSNSIAATVADAKEMTKQVFNIEPTAVDGTKLSSTPTLLGQSTQNMATPPTGAKTTSGTKTSVVFANDDQFDGKVASTRTDKNEAVKLFSPSSDVKVAGVKYSANLIWNLVVAP